LPEEGGNIVALTQLFWPVVHRALQEERKVAKFAGRRGDLKWGVYDYPVSPGQKATLDALWYMMSGLPRGFQQTGPYALPEGGYYSQNEKNGDVIIGLNHQSVTVHRTGRLTSNAGR
jgi:hypothetical protein